METLPGIGESVDNGAVIIGRGRSWQLDDEGDRRCLLPGAENLVGPCFGRDLELLLSRVPDRAVRVDIGPGNSGGLRVHGLKGVPVVEEDHGGTDIKHQVFAVADALKLFDSVRAETPPGVLAR